jgi:hypothetical protein
MSPPETSSQEELLKTTYPHPLPSPSTPWSWRLRSSTLSYTVHLQPHAILLRQTVSPPETSSQEELLNPPHPIPVQGPLILVLRGSWLLGKQPLMISTQWEDPVPQHGTYLQKESIYNLCSVSHWLLNINEGLFSLVCDNRKRMSSVAVAGSRLRLF